MLFVVFVCLSLFNIVNTMFKLRDVRAELGEKRSDQMIVNDSSERLLQAINELRALKDMATSYIEFTRQELPTVEFLSALEGAIPNGLKVTDISIRQGNVMMRGASMTDQEIVEFSSRLDGIKNIVIKVDAPVTTKNTINNRIISNFTITCNIKSVAAIASATAAAMREAAETGGESEGGTGANAENAAGTPEAVLGGAEASEGEAGAQ
jgi:hypothetical protein